MPVQVMLFTRKDCPNCPQAKKLLRELAQEMADEVKLEEYDLDREEDFLTALQNQVRSTPAVVVDGVLVAAGRRLAREEIVKAIQGTKAAGRRTEM